MSDAEIKRLHAEAQDMASAWSHWDATRKLYAPAPQMNILARYQPHKTKLPPNAANYPDMEHYNRAINVLLNLSMCEFDKERREAALSEFTSFVLYYGKNRVGAKKALIEFKKLRGRDITRQTYYNQINRFTLRAYAMCQSLKKGAEASSWLKCDNFRGGVRA